LLAAAAWLLSISLAGWLPGERREHFQLACWLLGPALFAILLLEMLRFRFAESDTLLFFLDPAHDWLLLTGPLVLLLSMLLLRRRWPRLGKLPGTAARLSPAVWLVLILLLGLALRAYRIDFQDLQDDEHISWDAARGILRTGAPESISGIYYTRSPLYHYLL